MMPQWLAAFGGTPLVPWGLVCHTAASNFSLLSMRQIAKSVRLCRRRRGLQLSFRIRNTRCMRLAGDQAVDRTPCRKLPTTRHGNATRFVRNARIGPKTAFNRDGYLTADMQSGVEFAVHRNR